MMAKQEEFPRYRQSTGSAASALAKQELFPKDRQDSGSADRVPRNQVEFPYVQEGVW